ncbi:MAG: cation-translocating P-type ATPase [Candidatus Aminicenantes bacterium]|nr:cation-translocating P-type ATPase [Candidatus Aminicenantes bacterium]
MNRSDWHALETSEVERTLRTDAERGLTDEETARRLEEFGLNELRKEEKISPLRLFLSQFKNILIVILLVAIGLSVAIGEVLDAVIIAVIVAFSAVLGFLQEFKAEKALESLKKMLSPTCTVVRDGHEREIPSKDLVPGDIVLLEAGDRIPADARLAEVPTLKCDEAALTGESVPVTKHCGALPAETRISDRRNMVFAGTVVTYGRAKAVVTATGMSTEFGRIAEEVGAPEQKKTPLEKRTAEIGKWLGLLTLVICVTVIGVSVVRQAVGGGVDMPFFLHILMFAVSLAVAAVPEALAAIVTGALAIAMHQMAKQNALVRKMPAVETLGCTTVICSDKTGTLTKGEMTVRKLYTGSSTIEVSGSGYEPAGEFRADDLERLRAGSSFRLLVMGGMLCNDSRLHRRDELWAIKGDPTEGALVVVGRKAGFDHKELELKFPRVGEIPFSSERKKMTTVHESPDGRRYAFLKGAPEVVLKHCSRLMDGDEDRALGTDDRRSVLRAVGAMAGSALRVLAVAYRILPDEETSFGEETERDMTFLGLFGMMDPPREEAIEAVRACAAMKIRTVMITGDNKATAVAVAGEIGIYKPGDLVLDGEGLENMPDEEFAAVVDRVTVYARVSPIDKLKIVKAWQARGEVVAMTGDGVNDAPALKNADIGVAMGITGTEVTKDAADLILNDDNFATILKAIERGRWIYDNIKKYLTYLLRCNITEVAVIGGIVLAKGPAYLPLLSAAILYINLATDGLPALALGLSPPDPDIMLRPPRNPRESIFSGEVKTFIGLAFLVEVPFFIYVFFSEFSHIDQARTEIFYMFIIVELVLALNFRSLRFSVLKAPPHAWLVAAVAWEIVLIAVLSQIAAVRDAFGIVKPTLTGIEIIIAFALAVFLVTEAAKAWLRRQGRKSAA